MLEESVILADGSLRLEVDISIDWQSMERGVTQVTAP